MPGETVTNTTDETKSQLAEFLSMTSNPKTQNPRFNDRKGSMLVLVAVALVVFMVAAAFSVDIAYMYMVKAEMRTAVDAASRAGTETLTRTQDAGQATTAAIQIASQNTVAGQGLTLRASDIEIGEATLLNTGKFDFTSGGTQLNSVRVNSIRDAASSDGRVGLFFGSVFGVGDFAPRSDAISAASVRDIALVLDRSGSMQGARLTALIAAVNTFIDEIESTSPNSAISLTTYATTATRDIALTEDFAPIRSAVNSMSAEGLTNIFQALQFGSDSLEFDAARRSFADRTIILMTDGNFNEGGTPVPSANAAAARNHTVHTITFSSGANQSDMLQVANIGGGRHIHADDGADLTEAFREIARTLSVVLID